MPLCTLTVFAISLLFIPTHRTGVAVAAKPPKSAIVDCSAGETILAALNRGSAVITISGTCVEIVTITESGVTIQGDPILGGTIEGRVFIFGAQRVVLDNLTIDIPDDGATFRGVVGAGGAAVTISNSVIQAINLGQVADAVAIFQNSTGILSNTSVSRAIRGVTVFGSSYLQIEAGSSVTDNTSHGILLVGGSSALIRDTVIKDNGSWEVILLENSSVRIENSTISSDSPGAGALNVTGSGARLVGGNTISNTEATGSAVLVSHGANLFQELGTDFITGVVQSFGSSIANFRNVEIIGDVRATQNGLVRIRNRSGVSGKTPFSPRWPANSEPIAWRVS